MQGEQEDISGQTQPAARCPDPTESSSHYCSICHLTFASNKSLRNHNSGSRHKKKAKRIERTKNSNVCAFYCELCCIELTSKKQQQQHLKGKNHEKKVMAERVGKEGTEDCEINDDKLNRTSAPRQKIKNQKVILETLLKSKEFSPQFIEAANLEASRLLDAQAERKVSAEKKKAKGPWYFCKVCSLAASSKKQLKEHIKGLRHKKNVRKSNEGEVLKSNEEKCQDQTDSDSHSQEHHIKEAEIGLISGPQTRQVHGAGRRGGSSTVHTERIAQHEDMRRLRREDVQRNAEMRGIHETKPHVPTGREKLTGRRSTGNPNLAAQTYTNAPDGIYAVDPILKSQYLPELKVGRGFNGTSQSERHSVASSNIGDRTVVYDYNHGIDESLDENTTKRVSSSHKREMTSVENLDSDSCNYIGQEKRSQEGDVLDLRAQKRQRLLGRLSGASFPVVEVKTELESDDDIQYMPEHHVSVGAERGCNEPDVSPRTRLQQKQMNYTAPNVKEHTVDSRLEQRRERNGRSSCASSLKKKEASAPSKQNGGSDIKLDSSASQRKTMKEGSGILMLPLEHIERQRAKVLKILNLGTQHEIENLNGVGKKRARMIMQWRQAVGGFQDVTELSNILGFGEKMLKAILL